MRRGWKRRLRVPEDPDVLGVRSTPRWSREEMITRVPDLMNAARNPGLYVSEYKVVSWLLAISERRNKFFYIAYRPGAGTVLQVSSWYSDMLDGFQKKTPIVQIILDLEHLGIPEKALSLETHRKRWPKIHWTASRGEQPHYAAVYGGDPLSHRGLIGKFHLWPNAGFLMAHCFGGQAALDLELAHSRYWEKIHV